MLAAAIDHVDKLVKERLKSLAEQAITDFKTICTGTKLSGDDSPLEDVWEEFKDQVQNGESFYWDAYEDTLIRLCGEYVNELPSFEFCLLWYWTEGYVQWHEDREEEPPYFRDDLTAELFRLIKLKAAYEPLKHEQAEEERNGA